MELYTADDSGRRSDSGAIAEDGGRRSDDVAAEDGTAERACLSEVCSTWQHTHNKHIRNT